MGRLSKEEQFRLLYEAYSKEIYQYVFIRTGLEVTRAEDITQDIFLEVFRSLERFKGLCSERTWIFKLTKIR